MEEGPDVAPASSAWYVWESEGQQVRVHLNLDVVERLSVDVREGVQAVPRRGLEVGGLLLGRAETHSGLSEVFVEDFAPVQSEHRSGPSYVLSDLDQDVLQEKIAGRDHAEGKRSVVGFYRSHTRPDFALAADDISLMSRYFQDPAQVFLLIQASMNAASVASFFVWQDGEFPAQAAEPQFPFEPAALAPMTVREVRPLPALAAVPPQAMRSEPAPAPARKAGHKWYRFAADAAVVIVAVAILWYRAPKPTPPAPANAPARLLLALNVAKDGERLRLSWDRNAPSIRTAERAALWIRDGDRQERLDLDTGQLTSGSVVYWPTSADIYFRLEVFTPKGNVTESVRSVGAAQIAKSSPLGPPLAQKAEAARVAPPRPPQRPIQPAPVQEPAEEVARPSPFRVPSAEVKPPAATPPVTAVARADVPAKEPAMVTAPGKAEANRPEPARLAGSFSSVTVEPVTDSRFGRVVRKIPLLRRLRKNHNPEYVPAKPLHQAAPSVPADVRRGLKGSVPVDVKVYVDESGKVEYAELVSGRGVDERLESLAVYSARRWQFSPARQGDQTVPSELILHYRFGEAEGRERNKM